MLAERLLGALELAVMTPDMTGAPDLSDYLGQPPTGQVAFALRGGQGQTLTAVTMLDLFRPRATDLAASLTQALAVAVASAVVGRWKPPDVAGNAAAAAIGAGIGAAVLLLRDAAMPAGYAAALCEQVRREHLMPRRSAGTVPVAGHQFALVEGAAPWTACTCC